MGVAKERRRWDRKWRDGAFEPVWRLHDPAAAVRRVVEDGWWVPGMRLLDLGCGAGEQAAWLAEQGLDVVGVDFSKPAIERAREAYAGAPRLRFEVVDVTARQPLAEHFDALLDRGCLHFMIEDRRRQARYAQNVGFWLRPGGRFLLLMHAITWAFDLRVDQVESMFARDFELVDARVISMDGPTASKPIPGGAFRLTRRA